MKAKKAAAPIVIAALLIAFYLGMAAVFLFIEPIPVGFRLLLCIIPAALIGVTVFVTYERMEEIRSGEEDDLSQY